MFRKTTLTFLVLLCLTGTSLALYSVSDTGDWPKTWPKELEELRKQSQTLVGPTMQARHYAIPFKTREEFEAAWPHLLKVKTKGAPIFLVKTTYRGMGDMKAGVWVHSPPKESKEHTGPFRGDPKNRSTWFFTTYIELVVDGEIVDLNRIPLPEDTPIVDLRFEEKLQ